MSKDKQTISGSSPERNDDSKVKLITLNGSQKLKSFDFDPSSGFVCDINTGICGPIVQEEEGKE